MEWWIVLFIIFGGLVIFMLSGLPIAFCFILLNMIGAIILWGGDQGLITLVDSMINRATSFLLLPLPLFILMGEVMYHSGIAPLAMDAVAAWLGRIPGRLGLVAVGAGTLFSNLTGASIATTAIMGAVLVPEMEARGYKKSMSLGPILGSGGLAIMIPPSSLAVLVGAVGYISIGRILMAIIIPGLLMAIFYALYIIIRCRIQPGIAPAYDVDFIPLRKKLDGTLRHILPVGLIFFMVIGFIFLGVATPTEAAATGCIGAFLLTMGHRRFNWILVKKAFRGTMKVTIMVTLIIVSADAYGRLLAFTGVSHGLVEFVSNIPVAPIVILIGMQIVLIIMGMFMSVAAVIMIFLPLYLPIVTALNFDLVLFAVMFLLNMEMGTTSPPFGLGLFTMKGVAPKDTTMGDLYRAALPFLYCDALVLALLMFFPQLALWLPNLMRGSQ
ncbi:TRAP transporter large permease subunit [Chloroflexota bacterium]